MVKCRHFNLFFGFLMSTSPLALGMTCCDESSCVVPQGPKRMFQCTASTWSKLIENYPPYWYQNPIVANFGMPKTCSQGNFTFLACNSDADCGKIPGSCVPKVISPFKLVNNFMTCCRHCVWNMQFPMGSPIQVAAGPVKNSSNELFMIPKLDCTTFPTEWANLDWNFDNFLNDAEFSEFVKTLPNRQLTALGYLNVKSVQQAADVNRDGLVSYEEYVAIRHFWTPVLISNSGPAPSGDVSIAEGPLGGFYWDEDMVSVWVTTANNILLRLYITNNWNSAGTREPLDGEEHDFRRNSDLDGSGRISFEEHYFHTFADIDGSGDLDRTEFRLSLYSDSLLLANGSNFFPRFSFSDHDVDHSGTISFLERKRVAADTNLDGVLDDREWYLGDFPTDAEVFKKHTNDEGVIGPSEYLYYLIYDYCTLYRWQRYNPPNSTSSAFPWNYESCSLQVVTHEALPFIKATVARRRRDLTTQSGAVLTGYSASVFGTLADRRGFDYVVDIRPSLDNTSSALAPPVGNLREKLIFTVGIFTMFQPTPDNWVCSSSMWPEDGFVIVVRAVASQLNLYIIVLFMVISPQFINFFSSLFFLVLAVGHVIWLLERWHNELQFRSFYSEGVIDGLWWAIVTQTTNGFGDKAPATLPGRLFGVLWMIFGLITFAIFAGQATSFIATATSVNEISDFSTLTGLSVGVPDYAPGPALASAYGFSRVSCTTLAACMTSLLDKSVDAVVAPRSDVVHHFVTSGLNTGSCGNPLLIVGDSLEPGSVDGLDAAVRVCTYGKGVYAASQLMQGMSEEIGRMTADGMLSARLADIQPFETVAETCSSPPTFFIPLNVAAVVVLLFFIIGRAVERRLQNKGLEQPLDIADIAALARRQREQSEGTAAQSDAAAGAVAPAAGEVAVGDVDSSVAKVVVPAKLPELDDVEEFVSVARRVGLFHAMQSGAVRKIQRELRKQKRLLSGVVKLLLYTSASVACGLAMVVGIIIATWSDKIQVANYD